MNTSRLDFVALTIAALLAWTGCQPAPKKSADRKQATPQVQRKAGSAKFVTNKDENSIPVRLLASDAVQKDLGLTADQMRKIKEVVQFSKEQLRELAATWQDISPGRAAQMSQARSQELAARAWPPRPRLRNCRRLSSDR